VPPEQKTDCGLDHLARAACDAEEVHPIHLAHASQMAARRLGWCRRQVSARLLALSVAGAPTPPRYLQRLRQRRSMQVEEGLAQLLLADFLLVNSFCGA